MDKPWTVSHGPIIATEFDVQKAEAISVLLIRPIDILPSKPGDQIRPFALGLFNDIRALVKPDVGATALRRAVGSFVHSKRYYFASGQPDSMRHDIDGKPVEPLSTADRLVAQRRFLNLKRNNDENSASSIESAPSPAPPSKTEQIRTALLRRDTQT
ncbi:conjugation repressor FinO/ProQ protein (plasmid) [Rhizobium gallicum]|uniref:Conjugation repressor FinO/ProQ protein n=3 Tax=Rhizobium TaxID=379 RepID=A0A1L5NQ67_9HYPH|nr:MULTISPECIES: ProQ/FINO family protein [Rhizobium]APO70037.1 conjugation repressor FinO/ProQ protein [Rhizobium gallicum]MBB4279359.1 sRNA-binding protein [Rhizobium mongolense]TCU33634.1 ProQ/FINO family protein [Rhizobium azibense]